MNIIFLNIPSLCLFTVSVLLKIKTNNKFQLLLYLENADVNIEVFYCNLYRFTNIKSFLICLPILLLLVVILSSINFALFDK